MPSLFLAQYLECKLSSTNVTSIVTRGFGWPLCRRPQPRPPSYNGPGDCHGGLSLLAEACAFAQNADRNHPSFPDVAERVGATVNDAIGLAYGTLDIDFLPSFARSEERPVLNGPDDPNVTTHRMKGHIAIMERYGKRKGDDAAVLGVKSELHFPDAWQATAKAHPSSSRLARFDGDLTLPSAASPLAEIIYGAAHHLKVGLTEIAFSSTADTKRKLIFLADSSRVKSLGLSTKPPCRRIRSELHSIMVLSLVLASERFLRAGLAQPPVWNLSERKTDGTDGRAHIGKHFNTRDTWRDEYDEIEDSSGSEPSSSLKFADSKRMPSRWHLHPSLPTTMLCASDPSITRDYSCVSLDLENGEKTVERYLGHGGEIYAFSTQRISIFTGAMKDEAIRLWDVRGAKMVYELATGKRGNEVMGLTWDDERSVLYAATSCGYMDRNGFNHGYRRAKIPKAARERDDEGDNDSMSDEDYDECWPANSAHAETYFRPLRYAFKETADPSPLMARRPFSRGYW
ncbi:hypothetical protein C8J57DRAFT_1222317 [Mycena rebaudengoi]|nr:hypothetical protein C8J57DRAFT_1222317 [Mycena rebaudengoi]